MTVTANDSMLASPVSTFKITVTNTAPYFISNPLKPFIDITMNFNTTYRFEIPPFKDDEDNQVYFWIDSVPTGVNNFIRIIDNE